MTKRRIFIVVLLALVGALAHAQSWIGVYEKGLQAAKNTDWIGARAAFQGAIALRPEDASGATTLPGPVTDRKQWRNGAPYSPNFLAAYSEYRIGVGSAKPEDGRSALQTAAAEFETLLGKGQTSRESFFFLNQIYTRLGDTAKRLDLESRYKTAKLNFRVDDEVIAPEELATMTGVPSPGKNGAKGTGPEVKIVRPGQAPVPGNNVFAGGATIGTGPAVGPVPPIVTKFALVIGNPTTLLKQGAVPFASDDAQSMREALVTHAGYPEANVDLVLNASKEQIMAAATALASRVPEEGTVLIFFAGNGVNIDGKDYLAGVDTATDTDPSTMVAKSDLYQLFNAKAARIFSFYEVPRTVTNGVYFGKEIPLVGSVAQLQSTIPGGTVSSEIHNGHPSGIFTDAIVSALQDIRSNRIPIMEFGWQVFNRSRGGGGGASGNGARQIPTLPVLTHMSDQDRF
jgi:hypothetical protein